ncbi:hypothetical protein AQUCO_00201334v1 [Aquilegia coerulea]|uniref:F-box associated beta-propeller type 3 domain-containing protein n=1 Tax=Aquilegia coerulea TaxID=218851 RepID=A0A2G5F7J0_AQUCA|nr:hypothetical protein AQUCO_00201334v1 [Aquilegia coerulea]
MIVHHPRFIKMHHAKATQNRYNVRVLVHVSVSLLFELKDDPENKQVFSEIILLESENDDEIEKAVLANPQFMPPKLELKPSDLKFEIVGSCNGLVLLAAGAYYDPVYVCNPVIGEYMSLPASNKKMGFEILSGIGYDQVADEYKVVRLIINFMDPTDVPNCKMEAEVYTLGSGKWRKLGNFLYPLCKRSCQVLVKSSLHWLTHENRGSATIIAFDVGREEFQTMSSPPEFAHRVDCEDCELDLAELGGYLCLFAYWFDNRCEIWVMKEYGVNTSWTKQHVVSRNVCGLRDVVFRPVTMMKNGNILLVIDNQSLVCYNPKRKRFRKLKIRLPPRFDAITHVGSFISLRDIAAPTNSKQCVNTRGWYGVMKSISSQNPDFDIEGWKLNEQLRRLWWENH